GAAEALNLPMATLMQGAARLWHEMGPVPLLLAVAALCVGRRRPVVYYAWAVAAFSSLAPLGLVYGLPGYAAVRFGVEWWFVAPFPAHLVSGLAVSACCQRFRMGKASAAEMGALLIVGATLWNWRAADVAHMRVGSVTPPPVLVSPLVDCVGSNRAFRLFWPD